MALQPATATKTVVAAPKTTKVVTAGAGVVKKKAAPAKKATPAKKAGPTAAELAAAKKAKEDAAKAKAAEGVRKAQEKADAQAARAVENETARRENALARIQEAALAAGTQKSRIELFIHKLQLRIERGCQRVAVMVESERARQAAALEKHPELKALASSKKELEAAAAIPEVEIPEDQLPGYITAIKEEVGEAA